MRSACERECVGASMIGEILCFAGLFFLPLWTDWSLEAGLEMARSPPSETVHERTLGTGQTALDEGGVHDLGEDDLQCSQRMDRERKDTNQTRTGSG